MKNHFKSGCFDGVARAYLSGEKMLLMCRGQKLCWFCLWQTQKILACWYSCREKRLLVWHCSLSLSSKLHLYWNFYYLQYASSKKPVMYPSSLRTTSWNICSPHLTGLGSLLGSRLTFWLVSLLTSALLSSPSISKQLSIVQLLTSVLRVRTSVRDAIGTKPEWTSVIFLSVFSTQRLASSVALLMMPLKLATLGGEGNEFRASLMVCREETDWIRVWIWILTA